MPQTPPPKRKREEEEEDGEEQRQRLEFEEEEAMAFNDVVVSCDDCGRELAEEGPTPADGEELPARFDFHVIDGKAWCRCGAPAEELDRA